MRDLAILLLLGALAGEVSCATTRVESLAVLEPHASATIEAGPSPSAPAKVSVVALTPLLMRATWVGSGAITKGAFWLEYPGGRRLRIAVGFPIFFVEGVPGHFEIRPEDRAAFEAEVTTLRRVLRTR